MSFIEQNKWCHWVFFGEVYFTSSRTIINTWLIHFFALQHLLPAKLLIRCILLPPRHSTLPKEKQQSIATKKEAKMKSKVRWKHHQNRQKLSRNVEAKQKKLLQVHWTSWRRRIRKAYVRIVVVFFLVLAKTISWYILSKQARRGKRSNLAF